MGQLKIKVGNHPEQQPGEVFLENASASKVDDYGWRTKRVGTTAYNQLGMAVEGLFPIFVQRKELEEFGYTVTD